MVDWQRVRGLKKTQLVGRLDLGGDWVWSTLRFLQKLLEGTEFKRKRTDVDA